MIPGGNEVSAHNALVEKNVYTNYLLTRIVNSIVRIELAIVHTNINKKCRSGLYGAHHAS